MRSFSVALALLCGAAPAAAERIIVVGSTGPSSAIFPRGSVIDERKTATLLPLDRVIVVDKDGTRVFSGPGPINFGRGTAAPSRWDDIRTLVTRTRETYRRKNRGRAGAVRGAAPVAGPDDPIWGIEWPAKGRYCFDSEFGIPVHVPDGRNAPAAFTFTSLADGESETEDVTIGLKHLPWPEELLPQPGQDRSFRVSAGGVSSTISLIAVPVRTLDPLALAEYVTSRRCAYPLSMFADKADQVEGK